MGRLVWLLAAGFAAFAATGSQAAIQDVVINEGPVAGLLLRKLIYITIKEIHSKQYGF